MASSSVLQILRTIKERGLVSRTELQQLTGLSWGTITNTTRELLNRHVVREEAAKSSRPGRKPTCLAVNTMSHCLLGLELAADCLRCQVVNLAGESLWYDERREMGSPEVVLERMASMAATARAMPEVSQRTCLGIGVAVAGSVDAHGGVIHHVPRMPEWREVKAREFLQSHFSVPVRVDQKPSCLAMAERWFGAAGEAQNVLCVNLAEEVGMGMLIHGEVYRGSQEMSGEFGHMTIDPEGPLCACGDRGCVEAYCGAGAVLARGREVLPAGAGELTLGRLLEEAKSGHTVARECFAWMGQFLGIGLANLIDILNPDVIVLAGCMTAGNEWFVPALDKAMEKHAWKESRRQVVISTLGVRGAVLGACGMVLQSAFSLESLVDGEMVGV